VRGSGNREDIEPESTEQALNQTPVTSKTETKEQIPFKKPVIPLPEHLKVTSIKDTLDKNKSANTDYSPKKETVPVIQSENVTETTSQETVSETAIPSSNPKMENEEKEIVFSSLADCWMDCVNEFSTSKAFVAVGLLSKQIPVDNESHSIEIEVPNEVAKQEIREIIPPLTASLTQKTGITYSFDIKIVKTVQEKQVDKANPDEKFKHLCTENPKLMDFKRRLNLSVS
jgi:hypothetical protein